MINVMVPQQFVGNHTGLPMNPAHTVMDSNGQQFFMVPVNPMPQMFQPGGNVHNANTPSFSGGRGGGGQSGRNSGQMRGRSGGRFRRNFTKQSGIFDAYCMNVAPLNIFENQVLPMGLHDISKSFRPNLATTRVFSLGTKFIPKWKNIKIKKPFFKFEDFRRRMTNKMFFEEVSPGSFVRNPKFGLKNNFWVPEQYKEIDEFCFRI